MAVQEQVKVQKDGQVKTINKKDVNDYVAAGWQEVKVASNPFVNTTYGNLNTIKK